MDARTVSHAWMMAAMLTLLGNPAGVRADRLLTGELVVADGAKNQFRIVQQPGLYTAPAGVSVRDLAGKPVEVEIGNDGRVLQITEKEIRFKPVSHAFEVITGVLQVHDQTARTFGIAGDNHTYTAPRHFDLSRYNDRLVELSVNEDGRILDLNLIARSADAPATRAPRSCTIGDASMASGTSICRRGATLVCTDGDWIDMNKPCN